MRPWHLLFQLKDQPAYSLPATIDIAKVYDDLEGELLILGAPGAGKTTTLLHLARTLISRAEADPALPIPVVFHLSSWASQCRPIGEWLVAELNLRYQVPRRLGQAWVAEQQVLPLLDGLDEVAPKCRSACIEAINQFREQNWLLGTVVCSRSADYEALGARLILRGAVMIQPLSPAQIDGYLQQGAGQLVTIRALLSEDRQLNALANTPLMLSIIVAAYHGAAPTIVQGVHSLDERRRHLFASYTQRMLARRAPLPRYTPQQTVHSLIWLAQAMVLRSQSVFLIEGLQPDWLDRAARRRYGVLVVLIVSLLIGLLSGLANGLASVISGKLPSLAHGLVIGAGGGLASGLAVGLLVGALEWLVGSEYRWEDLARPRWWHVLLSALPIACAIGLVVALTVAVAWSPIEGLAFGLVTTLACIFMLILTRQTSRIKLIEAYRWSLSNALRGLLPGLGLGMLAGLSFGMLFWPSAGLAVSLVLAFGTMFVFGLTSQGLESTTMPNQGIWRTARHAILTALGVGMLAALVHGATNTASQGLSYGLATGLTAGLIDLLIGGLVVGGIACIRHVVLRLLLWHGGHMPWNYARFLDHAADQLLLQRMGGSYIFMHRLLMDYFASLDPKPSHPHNAPLQPSQEDGLVVQVGS